MSIAVQGEAPEPKKFRSSLPTQVIVESPTFTYDVSGSPLDDAANGGQSPAGPSSARSPSSAPSIKEDRERDDLYANANSSNNLLYPRSGQSLVDAFSTAMIFQATSAYMKQMQPANQKCRGKSAATASVPPGPPIPGAIAAASSPAAALFSEDDWSWHRNPAAAIRSGGTNKQTPVWKFFVYNKAENLSRCIVGNCTYVLKGPHTSTLACHLKKHPPQYLEYQKLKAIYSRDRLNNITSNSSQMSVSPAPVSSGSGGITQPNGCCSRMKTAANSCNSGSGNILRSLSHDTYSTGNSLSTVKRHVPISTVTTSGKQSSHSVSNILDVLNARANVAALAGGNVHLLQQHPVTAMFNTSEQDNCNNVSNVVRKIRNISGNSTPIKNIADSSLADVLTANLLMAASNTAAGSSTAGRKWNREDRKQKEMEVKLALMLSATQIPLNIVENSFFREFIEFVQPRFSMPNDVNYVEEIINAEHSRTIVNLKNQLTTAKKVAVMIDVLKLNTPTSSASLSTSVHDKEESKDLESKDSTSVNSDSGFEVSDENQSGTESPKSSAVRTEEMRPLVRLCVSVAFHNPLAQRVEVALLGVRPLADLPNITDAIQSTVEQILFDFDVTTEKVSRYLCNDVRQLVSINVSRVIFPRMLEPYNQKLMQSLLSVIDANKEVDELKKNFYSMILNFITRPNAIQLLQQAVGRPVSLPIADSFLVLIDAILELKDAFLTVCAQISSEYPLETISETQWEVLENLSRLLRLFHTHMKVVQNGVYATIDGVVPSLMQLQVSLEKDFAALGNLANQVKVDLQKRTASMLDITAPDFDGTFIQATALNPQLALLLDDEQLAYARNAIEQELNGRMRVAEEIVARRTARLNGGVDALLATVTDRAAAASSLTGLSDVRSGRDMGGVENGDGTLTCQNVTTTTSLYPDLIQFANERRKMMKEKQHVVAKNRYAEAIVQSYFDELAAGTNQTSQSSLAVATGAVSVTLNSRNLAPLQYWQFNTVKYGLLAEIATELLTIPSSTVSLERIFATSSPDIQNGSGVDMSGSSSSSVTFDPITLIKTIDEPARMERDAILRFNRSLMSRF